MATIGTRADRAALRLARMLIDTCDIHRQTVDLEAEELDPDTLELVEPAATLIWSGPCLVAVEPASPDSDSLAGPGQNLAVARVRVRIPLSAPAPEPGDRVTITASRDSALDGLTCTVTPGMRHTLAVTRHVVADIVDRFDL